MAVVSGAGLTESARRRILAVLCVTEITSWGALYYAFIVLAGAIAADTGWSRAAVSAALSASLVVAGVVGIPLGWWLDTRGPRLVMTAGSTLAVPLIVGIALAPTYAVFFVLWCVAGVSIAATHFQPAFAAVTRWYGRRRVRALTVLTLGAGFSSTIFAPLTAALSDWFGWRGAYLVLAALLAVVTVPAHAIGLRGPWPTQRGDPTASDAARVGPVVRSAPFLLLTTGLALAAFAVFAVIVHQVPLLEQRGLSTSAAAWALGLSGVGQVVGRLGYPWLSRRTSPKARAVVTVLLVAGTTGAMAVLPGPAPLLIGVAVASGMARGIFILLQATVVGDWWPQLSYPRLNAVLAAPGVIAMAIAPVAGSTLADALGGYAALFAVLAAATLVAAAMLVGGSASPAALGHDVSDG